MLLHVSRYGPREFHSSTRSTRLNQRDRWLFRKPRLSTRKEIKVKVKVSVKKTCSDFFESFRTLRLLTWISKKGKVYKCLHCQNSFATYPSIKKPVEFSTFCIAAARSSRTTSLLTSPPFDIVSWSSLPFGDPDATSARNKSPVDRWENLYLATILSHWVPLPQPGPPSTQIIGTFESITWKTMKSHELSSYSIKEKQVNCQKAHQVVIVSSL